MIYQPNVESRFTQNIGEILDYSFDFQYLLLTDGDAITSLNFVTSEKPLVISINILPYTATNINFRATGLVIGSSQISCEISTTLGRTYNRCLFVDIIECS